MREVGEDITYDKHDESGGSPYIEPSGKLSPDLVRRIIDLDPQDHNYPLRKPFEDYYRSYTKGNPPSNAFLKKHAVAVGMLEGGYSNPRQIGRASCRERV